MVSLFDKLNERLKKELDMQLMDYERCYPGYWQRIAGAWSWRAKLKGETSVYDYGSQDSLGRLNKAKSISFSFSAAGGEFTAED